MLFNDNRGTINRQERELAQQVALGNLRRYWGKSAEQQKQFDALALEVRNGECTLAEQNGGVVRIVAFVTYNIVYKGTLLVVLGIWKNDKVCGRVCLPETRQANFERVEEAIHRDSNGLMLPFRSGLQIGELEYSEYSQKSDASTITTVYQKSLQHVKVSDGFEFPMLPLVTCSKIEEAPQMGRFYNVFVLRVRDRLRLYAWLRPEDYDFISNKAEGKASFAKWMELITVDEAAAQEAVTWTTPGLQANKPKVRLEASVVSNFKCRFQMGKQDPGQDTNEDALPQTGPPRMPAWKRGTLFPPGQVGHCSTSPSQSTSKDVVQTSFNLECEVGSAALARFSTLVQQEEGKKSVEDKKAAARAEIVEYRQRRKTLSTAARVLYRATAGEMLASTMPLNHVKSIEHSKAAVGAALAECRREALMEQGFGSEQEAPVA